MSKYNEEYLLHKNNSGYYIVTVIKLLEILPFNELLTGVYLSKNTISGKKFDLSPGSVGKKKA